MLSIFIRPADLPEPQLRVEVIWRVLGLDCLLGTALNCLTFWRRRHNPNQFGLGSMFPDLCDSQCYTLLPKPKPLVPLVYHEAPDVVHLSRIPDGEHEEADDGVVVGVDGAEPCVLGVVSLDDGDSVAGKITCLLGLGLELDNGPPVVLGDFVEAEDRFPSDGRLGLFSRFRAYVNHEEDDEEDLLELEGLGHGALIPSEPPTTSIS